MNVRMLSGWFWRNLRIDLLLPAFLVVLSSIVVIYVVQCNRHAYDRFQQVKNESNNADISYGQLLLQYGALTAYERIEHLAREKLDMKEPGPENIILVRP